MDASGTLKYNFSDYKMTASLRFLVSLIFFVLFAQIFNLFSFAYTFDLNWLQTETLSEMGISEEERKGLIYDFSQKSYIFVMMKFGFRDLILYFAEVVSLIVLVIGFGQLLDPNISTKKLITLGACLKLPYGIYLYIVSSTFYFSGDKITEKLQYYTDISFNRFFSEFYANSQLMTSFLSINITIVIGMGIALYVLSKMNGQRLLSTSNLLLVLLPILTIASVKYLIS